MLNKLLLTGSSPAQFFIRIALGVVYFPHGAQKVLGWFGGPGFSGTIENFAGMGFPAWSVILLMIFEFFGALMLIIGFLSRLWALGLGFSITLCMMMSHIQHGFFMNWFGQQQGEGIEYHLLVIGICLALAVTGSGWLSVDRAVQRG